MTMPAADALAALLRPERLTAIVDIGANPLDSDGEPPYRRMLVNCIHHLIERKLLPQGSIETYLAMITTGGAAGA